MKRFYANRSRFVDEKDIYLEYGEEIEEKNYVKRQKTYEKILQNEIHEQKESDFQEQLEDLEIENDEGLIEGKDIKEIQPFQYGQLRNMNLYQKH